MRPALQLLLALALLVAPKSARAERVEDFRSVVHVQRDGARTVEDTVLYDFEGSWRPGIIRDLPTTAPGSSSNAVESVTDEVGRPIPF